MFLRVILNDGRDHLYNLLHVKAIFPVKGTRLALDLGDGDVVYTKNEFQGTVNSLYSEEITRPGYGLVINATEHA
jgi:hypothetical protein